jgi:hypothetical protein
MTKRELSELDRMGRAKAAEIAGIDPGLLQTVKLRQALASSTTPSVTTALPSSPSTVPSSPPLSPVRPAPRDAPGASSSVAPSPSVASPRVSREERLKAASPKKNFQSYGWDSPTPPPRSFVQEAQTVGRRGGTPLQHGRSHSGVAFTMPVSGTNGSAMSPVVIPTGARSRPETVRSFSYGGPIAPMRLISPPALSPQSDVVRSPAASRRDDVFARLSGRSATRAAISELTAALYNMNIKK